MIVDTSVMMALLLNEPEAPMFLEYLERAPHRWFSAFSQVELSTVIARRFKSEMFYRFDAYLSALDIDIAPVTAAQSQIGRAAYRRYGRGLNPLSCLNFGDCFAYALAIDRDEPLLFSGDDFIHTDVKQAIPR